MGLVSWLILLPLITALAVILVPQGQMRLVKWVSVLGSGLHLILTAVVSLRFVREFTLDRAALISQPILVERVPWFKSLGIEYFVGVDGVSIAMVVLTSLVVFCGVLASWDLAHRTKEFFAFLFVLSAGVFGVFVSFDLFLFFVFYEVAVLPMYLLIGIWGTGPKEYAAMKLTLMLLAGSAFVLVGFLALYHQAGLQSFDLNALAAVSFPAEFQRWVFPALFVGFGVLGALFPFHTWSPDGHASAPTAVSMLHAGVLMKLGGYGILRIAVYLLPEGAKEWALVFMVLATINIVYGAFAAITQKDLKYFTAYSSVSHCGFVLFGITTLNIIGFKGAVIQMFSHGVMTALFFALIGMVYSRTHTRMMNEMGGLARVMPWLAVSFYIAGLASLGLPGLSGFVAESHVFIAGFFANPWHDPWLVRLLTTIATASLVVTAVYVLRGLGTAFLGEVRSAEHEQLRDASFPEKLSTGLLVFVLVIVGVLPFLIIDLIEGSLFPFVNRLHGGF